MEDQQRIQVIDINLVRLLQDFVKRPVVDAKRYIEHLQFKWGENWRNHISELRGVNQNVLDQLAFLELDLPLTVERVGSIYVAQNGTHTAYSYWENGRDNIAITETQTPFVGKRKIYTFSEIRIEDS